MRLSKTLSILFTCAISAICGVSQATHLNKDISNLPQKRESSLPQKNINKPKLIDLCEQWLKNEGYGCTRQDSNLLRVRYEGDYFQILTDKDDPNYLCISSMFNLTEALKIANRLKVLETSAKINEIKKVVKVFPDDDALIFTTEILLDESPDIEDVLPRLLSIIAQAPKEFFELLHEKNK